MYTNVTVREAERVIYRQNPLRSVICQLRFPPILSIESTLPAEFQNQIRRDFPLFAEGSNRDDAALLPAIEQLIPQDLRQAFLTSEKKRYQFSSKDQMWSVYLSRDFVSLETRKYLHWEQFCAHLQRVVAALISVYSPDSFGRLGLRYQNAVDRDVLGLSQMPWRELFSPVVLGPLGLPEFESAVAEQNGMFFVRLNDAGDFIRVNHGLARSGEAPEDGLVYLLDNDLFTSGEVPAEVNNVINRASEFNKLNRNFFRWCILDPLHTAMDPEPAN